MSLNTSLQDEHKIDLRIRRTHKLLWEALMALLNERDFDDISVTDICERAMIHRTTFYKHYQDKNDLLLRGMREMHDALVASLDQPDALDEDAPYRFVRIFRHVEEHRHFYELMLCGNGIASFQTLLRNYLAELSEARLLRHLKGEGKTPSSIPLPIIAQFCSGAILSLTSWWLENNMPCTSEEMARYTMHLIADGSHCVLGLPSTWPPKT